MVLRRRWFFHFHVNIMYRLNCEMEEKWIVARGCFPGLSPARAQPAQGAPAGDNPGQRAAFSGQRGSGGQPRETIADNNPFLLHVAVPHSVSLWKYQRPQRTRHSLVFSPNGFYGSLRYCVACYAA